jgi:hypothetical protein
MKWTIYQQAAVSLLAILLVLILVALIGGYV